MFMHERAAIHHSNLWLGCWVFLALLISSCQPSEPAAGDIPAETLFTSLPAAVTGIDFVNTLEYTETYNPYTFRNFYNGGGVALGDLNNDGLLDIFFCGNLVDNKLYLNQGDFYFEDVTRKAGVASSGVWTAGVALADVNADGWLDIYLCKSGDPSGSNRHNELFINNGADAEGQISFTESARVYGIDDLGLSTHAAFFDYDGDGDLDLYLLNNSIRSVGGYDLRKNQRKIRDQEGGNKLYRNNGNTSGDGPVFVDVSEEAGIYGSNIGFGLGVTIGDVNRDTWPDIYVSNDFFERDYLYINTGKGSFREELVDAMPEISLSSMGADMADLTNDGFPEVFVTDMLPGDEARMKTKTAFENWNKHRANVEAGYHRQFTRNVLQLNLGTAGQNAAGTFAEIGRMAGVYATDWSWGALLFDMDNDGRKDIFVANGIYKDLTDQDYVNFYSDPETVRALMRREKGVITKLIDAIPSQPLPNYAFHNNGYDSLRGWTFTNRAAEWGLGQPSFSNGSAYGDLDNDGDLDLVTNNVNMPPFVFRNEAGKLRAGKANFLSLDLKGVSPNTFAIGAQVTLKAAGQSFYQELFPMRGFESSVDHRLLFGLGSIEQLDSLIVRWPDGGYTVQTGVAVNQRLTLSRQEANATMAFNLTEGSAPLFRKAAKNRTPAYRHQENDFVDFDRDRLIYHMLSAEGPRMALGDVNGDGRQDVFIGGAKDSPGALFVQERDGSFSRTNEELFAADQVSEDTDALFFDADGDGDQDLYVCSGGNEFPASSSALADRLYLNNGRGRFTKSNQVLPSFQFESTSCVSSADFDGDGDQDLFVGVRLRPFFYGVPVRSYVLENDGRGQFKDATQRVAPELMKTGMCTDAQWWDYDGDGDADLVVVGEYTPVRVFQNDKGRFGEVTAALGLDAQKGWWNKVLVADLNGDRRPDLVLGNHGLNTRFQAGLERPVTMYINDFDLNGTAEQLLTVFNGDKAYPLPLLHDLVKQMPSLRKRYLKYASYKEQTVDDIFPSAQREGAVVLTMNYPASSIALNRANGRFDLQALPAEAQMAPVYALEVEDVDGDRIPDILLGGNFLRAKPEVGSYAATYGLLLRGKGNGQFVPVPPARSGLRISGEIRDLQIITAGGKPLLLVARNNADLEAFDYQN